MSAETVAERFARITERKKRLATLADYYGWSYTETFGSAPDPERFCAVREFRSLHATFEEACAELADQVLDSGAGQDLCVYDLDTGERIEVHISTPVVTRSEDQGAMENPLVDTGWRL